MSETPKSPCPRWPRCGCIQRGYVNDSPTSVCGTAGCTCDQPHVRPWWYCAIHGEVSVDAG
jgi:hypothetical protein